MAIIINRRSAALNELERATASIASAMQIREQLDESKEERARRKREEERQRRHDKLNEELMHAAEGRAVAAEGRAASKAKREEALFPIQEQAAAQSLNAASLETERAAESLQQSRTQATRQEQQYEAGKSFWKLVAETPPDKLGEVIAPQIGELSPNLQSFAYEEVRRAKRTQIFDGRYESAVNSVERAVKDGVFASGVDQNGAPVTDPSAAANVDEMLRGVNEWHELMSSGDPAAEEVARRHPYSPDAIEGEIRKQRALRTKQAADQASNLETLQMLEGEYAALSPLLFPPGSQERESSRFAIEAFKQRLASATGDDRSAAVMAFSQALGRGRDDRQQPIDLGSIQIARDPNVPMEGVDWMAASDAQKARLESYALERFQKRQGANYQGEPKPEVLDRETQRLARELGWTNVSPAGAKKARALDDLTGKERKALEAEAAGGASPEQLAAKYSIDPAEKMPVPVKLQAIKSAPKAKRYQVGQLLIRASREGMTGVDVVQELRRLGIEPESVTMMSEEEHKALLKDAGYDDSSVLDPKKPEKQPVYPGNNRGR